MTTPTSDPELIDLTTEWLNLLLDSVDLDKISKDMYWSRAESALTTAAAGASTIGAATTTAARKLQITVTHPRTDVKLVEVCAALDPVFERWRALVAAESVYLVALTRVDRAARKEKKS